MRPSCTNKNPVTLRRPFCSAMLFCKSSICPSDQFPMGALLKAIHLSKTVCSKHLSQQNTTERVLTSSIIPLLIYLIVFSENDGDVKIQANYCSIVMPIFPIYGSVKIK